jgi:hypothetical protein
MAAPEIRRLDVRVRIWSLVWLRFSSSDIKFFKDPTPSQIYFSKYHSCLRPCSIEDEGQWHAPCLSHALAHAWNALNVIYIWFSIRCRARVRCARKIGECKFLFKSQFLLDMELQGSDVRCCWCRFWVLYRAKQDGFYLFSKFSARLTQSSMTAWELTRR